MKLDEALDIINEETTQLKARLKERGISVYDIDFDEDDIGLCEPVGHIHIWLDEDWFFRELDKES